MKSKKSAWGEAGQKRRVVLDTNFLLIPYENKLDVFAEIRKLLGEVEFMIPEPVIRELHLIAGKNTGAKVALELLEGRQFTAVGSDCSADEAVVGIAEEYGAYVASMDAKVRRRARGKNLKLVTLRGGDRIILRD